jgi:RNA polymerase sigma-70 factor (ECF subfamily)
LLRIAHQQIDGPLKTKGSSSDLVQDTFLEAHRIFDRFQGASAPELRAWLHAILLNKVATFTRRYRDTRKRQAAREVSLDVFRPMDGSARRDFVAAGPTPSSRVVQNEQATALAEAMERLPDHYRQVIRLRQWEDQPFEVIARELGRSVDATRMLWWRAIARLHKELEPQ